MSYRYCTLEEKIEHIIRCEYKFFLSKPNVVGIGLGYKLKNNFFTNSKCIQVYVKNKISKCNLPQNALIPLSFKGVQTDVIETGVFNATSLRERKRPLQGGYCISPVNQMQNHASIGCLVSNGVSNFLLSVNHGIAGLNEFPIGMPITQPSYEDGGRFPEDVIGTLHRFVPLRFSQGEDFPINYTDCALGLLNERNILQKEIAFIGRLRGVKSAILGETVRKVGSISELTTGTIQAIHATLIIGFRPGKVCLFQDLTITNEMTYEGDSGAILVNRHNYGLGMSISSTVNTSVFCNLKTVLDQLQVHLVT